MSTVGNLSENLEDYLERIFDFVEAHGFAKVSDIAKLKNVKMSSVNSAVQRLTKEGLVVHDRYRHINLTGSGLKLAAELKRRHVVIKDFLTEVVGVRDSIADKDACGIEHHVHPETVNKLIKYSNECRSDSKELIPLTQMKSGEHGTVKALEGGDQFANKLASLGIRIGKRITKISSMVLRGPVVISINRRHVAMGFGMAKKILVETE